MLKQDYSIYLVIHSKLPQNLVTKNNKHVIPLTIYVVGTQEQPSGMALPQDTT